MKRTYIKAMIKNRYKRIQDTSRERNTNTKDGIKYKAALERWVCYKGKFVTPWY